MADDKMMAQISGQDGFIAALDQSGGSTPGALRLYGIPDSAYSSDAEMFWLIDQMQVRILTSPAFTAAKVIAAILFEGTMDGEAQAAVVAQQFDVAARIGEHGLIPIIEPEVSIKSPDKAGAEAILRAELTRRLDAVPDGRQVMLKLTIPDVPNFYSVLSKHERVARVVALSGGYTRAGACRRLSANHGMITSFSRALTEDLRYSMSRI
jgi:fructose-bisphosphate aldolase class 1